MVDDAFETHRPGLSSPIDRFEAVTPDDAADLPGGLCRAVYIGTGGDMVVQDRHGTELTLTVLDGAVLPFRLARVLDTGTTASGIVALY